MKNIQKIVVILLLVFVILIIFFTLARVIGYSFGLEEEKTYCNRMPGVSYGFLSDLKLEYQRATWRGILFGTRCLGYVY